MRKLHLQFSRRQKILFVCLLPFILYFVLPLRYLFAPNISSLATANPATTSFVKFRQSQWKKRDIHRSIQFSWISYANIPKPLINAIVSTEDAGFWKHHGFDFGAMRYAFQANLQSNSSKFGASTISQQLAKNLFLNPSKSINRKVSEALLTWRIERTLSKKRILEIYCNVIEWGDGIFGIRQASTYYYHKSPDELTDAEIARLVAVIPGPLRYKLHSDSRYLARRTDIILNRMHRKNQQLLSTKLLRIDTSVSPLPAALPMPIDTTSHAEDTGVQLIPTSDSAGSDTSIDTLGSLPDVNK